MEKKILIAVDDSIHSTHAVEYAVRVSSVVEELTYRLFFVQPTLSQYLLDEAETNLKAKAELKKLARKNADAAQRVLEKHMTRMVRMGIDEKRIDTDTRKKVVGVAKDILDYAEQGLYDAILIGRRGLSRLQQTFMGSAAAGLVEHSVVIPVWVVDGEVSSNKLLLAVDGSEASLRAVDHISFMLGGNKDIELTMLHVAPTLRDYCVIDFDEKASGAHEVISQSAKRCVDHFYGKARQILENAGLREGQIDLKVIKRALEVGKTISNQAKKEDYGTVIVGRRGANQSFFMGSVSRQVLDRVSGRAVWVVS